MTPSRPRTSTMSPGAATILVRVPLTGAGSTSRAFSASISTRSAPSSTVAPSATYHSTTSASDMPMLSCGSRISVSISSLLRQCPARGRDDLFDVGIDLFFQYRAERHVYVVGGDPDDRGLQRVEAVFHHL